MKDTIRSRAAHVARRVAPGVVTVVRERRRRSPGGGPGKPTPGDLAKQVARLRRRVGALEREVQENRRLNRRVAELTDVVQELLLPAANRDDETLRARLDDYGKGL